MECRIVNSNRSSNVCVPFIGFLFPRFWNDSGKALELPLWLGYGASIFTFGAGFIGVSYGFLSASWDPEREGDFVGFEEAKKNIPALLSKYGIKLGDESQS